MSQQLRAVVGARVSVVQGPQKVSHIAQHATGDRWADQNGAEVVGRFEDLNVSATVSPFDRPDLGQWFKVDMRDRWDALVFSKIDRAFRSISDAVDVAKWCKEHHKMLVFAEDGLKLDYRAPDGSQTWDSQMAEMFIFLGAFFGQLELARFRSRAKDAHSVLLPLDRWASGVPPLGFRTVDHPRGKGKTLDTDPEGKEILRQMAGRLISGWSYSRIAVWLNESGIRTEHQRERARKQASGEKSYRGDTENPWTVYTVKSALTEMKTQGFKVNSKGEPHLLPDGSMIRVGPATFDDATWSRIQDAAALRSAGPKTKTETTNELLGVGFCACGASLVQSFDTRPQVDGTPRRVGYYRCGKTPKRCPNTTFRLEFLNDLVAESFLADFGDIEVTERVFVPGEDHSAELERVRATITRLRKESDMGLIVGEDDEAEYLTRMESLVERRTTLEQLPSRPSGWERRGTGQTYREVWDAPDTDRRELLIRSGIKLVITSATPLVFAWEILPDSRELYDAVAARLP